MTAYLRRSYPAKRINILQKREREFVNAIKDGIEIKILTKLAEEIRAAQLAIIKAKEYYLKDGLLYNLTNKPRPEPIEFERLRAEKNEWSLMPVEDIIKQYQSNPKLIRYPEAPFASS